MNEELGFFGIKLKRERGGGYVLLCQVLKEFLHGYVCRKWRGSSFCPYCFCTCLLAFLKNMEFVRK